MQGQDSGASNSRIADRCLRAVATHCPAPSDASQPVRARRARRLDVVAGPSTCPALTTGAPKRPSEEDVTRYKQPRRSARIAARDGTVGIVANRHDTQCRPGQPRFPSPRCLGSRVCPCQADGRMMFDRMLFTLACGSRIGGSGPVRALRDAASAGRGMQVAGPVVLSGSDSRCGRSSRLRL